MNSSFVDTLTASSKTRPSARPAHPLTPFLRVLALALLAASLAGALLAHRAEAAANTPTVYSFLASPDGNNPEANLVQDANGNFWGTTVNGGSSGDGVVYEIMAGTLAYVVVHSFTSSPDGATPVAGLTLGRDGNLYGTTQYGGSYKVSGSYQNYGTFFKIVPNAATVPGGTYTSLYSFGAGTDGIYPSGTAVQGPLSASDNSFFVPCQEGGADSDGAIVKISSAGLEDPTHPIYSFGIYNGSNARADGNDPIGPLTLGRDNYIYGTCYAGGKNGYGAVFAVNDTFTQNVTTCVSMLGSGKNGYYPAGGVVQSSVSPYNFYGTTTSGGDSTSFGEVFSMTPYNSAAASTFTQHLYDFQYYGYSNDGAIPGSLLLNSAGTALYGTTEESSGGEGAIFSTPVTASTADPTIYDFSGAGTDGGYPFDGWSVDEYPASGLFLGSDGYYWGTTYAGGSTGNGVVFRAGPPSTYNYAFFDTTPASSLSTPLGYGDIFATQSSYTTSPPSNGTLTVSPATLANPLPAKYQSTSTPATGIDSFKYTVTNTFGTSTTTYGNAMVFVGAATGSGPVTYTTSSATAALSVAGPTGSNWVASDSTLLYTWATSGTPPAAVAFSGATNGTNPAKGITATFTKVGTYNFTCTITSPDVNPLGEVLNQTYEVVNVTVVVSQSPRTAVTILPANSSVATGSANITYTTSPATVVDEFGNTIVPVWTVTNSGTGSAINSASGVLTVGGTAGTATIKATLGTATPTTGLTVTAPTTLTLTQAAEANGSTSPPTVTVTTNTAALSVAATSGSPSSIVYAWSVSPTAGVSAPPSASNSASSWTATFTTGGTYTFTVTITQTGQTTLTSSVTVNVVRAAASIALTPSYPSTPGPSLESGSTLSLQAQVLDQFGAALATQPTVTWTTGDSVSPTTTVYPASTTLTAGNTAGAGTVVAADGSITAIDNYHVYNDTPTVTAISPVNTISTTATLTAVAQWLLGDGSGTYLHTTPLTFSWAKTGGTGSSTPTLTAGSTTYGSTSPYAATNTENVTFPANAAYGSYIFTVTVTTPGGKTATATVTVNISQVATTVVVTPPSETLPSPSVTLTATEYDQYGNAMATQPTSYTWSDTNSGGAASSISGTTATATLTAGTSPGTATVTAKTTSGTILTSSPNTYTIPQPTITAATPTYSVSGASISLIENASVSPSETLTYTWSCSPSVGAISSVSNPTVTLPAVGTYTFQVIVSATGATSVTKTVTVTVGQVATTLVLTPQNASPGPNVEEGTTQVFTATVNDQFGNALSPQPTINWTTTDALSATTGASVTVTYSGGTGSSDVTASTSGLTTQYSYWVDNNDAPVITSVTANPATLTTGTTTQLTAVADWPINGSTTNFANGSGQLTFTWAKTGGTGTSTPTLTSAGATTYGSTSPYAATNVENVTFPSNPGYGTYIFTVTVTGPSGHRFTGQSASATVTVTINQVATTVTIAPNSGTYNPNGMVSLTATEYDQNGNMMATQPAFSWSIVNSGGAASYFTSPGTLTFTGDPATLHTGTTNGTATVTATAGSLHGTGTYTIQTTPATFSTAAEIYEDETSNTYVSGTYNDPFNDASVSLYAAATDSGATITSYSWAVTSSPTGSTYSISPNAQSATASFSKAGTYVFTVTATASNGATATSSVTLVVGPVPSSLSVSPNPGYCGYGGTEQFSVTELDQWGNVLSSPTVSWAAEYGSISGSGLFTANGIGDLFGSDEVQASDSTVTPVLYSSVVTVNIPDPKAGVATEVAGTTYVSQWNAATGTTISNLTVLGQWLYTASGTTYNLGESNLTYVWKTSGAQPGTVTFSDNNDNTAKNATATFGAAGPYFLYVDIKTPDGQITRDPPAGSNLTIMVNQTLTKITVTQNPTTAPTLGTTNTPTFSAVATDQFSKPFSTAPTFTWSTTLGSINPATGQYSATTPGTGTVTATATVNGITLTGTAPITVVDIAPTVATAAAANNTAGTYTTTATSVALTVLGAWAGGESNLTYTWAVSPTAGVSLPASGTNASKNLTATFTAAGTYTFTVTIADGHGGSVTSSVTVKVNQALTSIVVTPASMTLPLNGTQNYTATGYDQFSPANVITGLTFTWTTTLGSIVSTSGAYTGSVPGTGTVTATSTGISGSTPVIVSDTLPTVATAAKANGTPTTYTTTATSVALTVLGAWAGGESNLTYTWAVSPTAGVSLPASGTNASKNLTATFTAAGTYTFTVTISDGHGGSVQSSVTVNVNQLATKVTVTPSSASVPIGTNQGFTASATDQFTPAQPITGQTFTWSYSGDGTGYQTGLFTAGATTGTATVTATATGTTASASAAVTVTDIAPTLSVPTVNPSPVTGTTATLSVTGNYAGTGTLTYTWTATSVPTGGSVAFTGGMAGQPGTSTSAAPFPSATSTVATFTKSGSYTIQVVAKDASGTSSAPMTVTFMVNPTYSSVTVSPNPISVPVGGMQTFTAVAYDQFHMALTSQPMFTWSVSNTHGAVSTINSATGVLTAGGVPGSATVMGASGAYSDTSAVTITDVAPTVGTVTVAPSPVTGTTATFTVTGSYAGTGPLTYAWTVAGPQTVGVTGGTSGAPGSSVTATGTFAQAGSYTVYVTVTTPQGQTVNSATVPFTVAQTATGIQINPDPSSVAITGTETLNASEFDQFGTAMASQPTFAWSIVSGGGSIGASGASTTFTGGAAVGTTTIKVAAGAVSQTGTVHVLNQPPTVATSAEANGVAVQYTTTAASVNLTVLGAYAGGESNLTYTWSLTSSPATVTYSANGSNAAKNTTATFTKPGTYDFHVQITDTAGGVTGSDVEVVVQQVLTTISVTPGPTDTEYINTGTQTYTATGYGQFGFPMATQPTFTWSTTGLPGSSINSSTGVFTVGPNPGTATVTATSGSVSGSTVVTVDDVAPTVQTAASANPSPVTGTSTVLSVLGQYPSGESRLHYTWVATTIPSGAPAVVFSGATNGTNASKTITATFGKVGSYSFTVTLADGYGGSATSSVTVTVTQTPTTITVTPNPASVAITGTQQFAATVTDQFGTAITGATYTWSVKNGYGTITAGGLYTAGTVSNQETVEAAYSGTTGDATVNVTDVNPTVVTAASANPTTVTGTTTSLSVLGGYVGGESSLHYTWSASPSAGVTYSENGDNAAKNTTATFTAPGTYTFTVMITNPSSGSVTSTVMVVVNSTLTTATVAPNTQTLNIGDTLSYTVTGADQFGAPVTGATYTWSSTGVGSIVSGTGVYSAGLTPGTATIKATSGTVSDTATVTVVDVPPTVATVATASPSTVTGTTTALSVLGSYIGGESNLTYTWTVTPTSGVSLPTSGTNASKNITATFTAAGTYTFKVTIADGYGGTATSSVMVTVLQTPTLTVSPSTQTLLIGGSKTFTASVVDQFGSPITGATITWSNTGVGSVSASGVYTAGTTPGTATVTASTTVTAGSASGSATVTVNDVAPTLGSITVNPNPVTGTTATFTATATYTGAGNLTYAWTTSGTPPAPLTFTGGTSGASGSSVTATGTFTKHGTYTVLVTVTDTAGTTATQMVTFTVSQTATTLTLTPSPVSVTDGTTQQFTAVVTDQFGDTLATQPTFTWSSSGSGSINSSGLYTAPLVPGTATVTVTAGSLSGSSSVTDTDAPPTVGTAASASPSPVTGTTTNVSVLGTYVAGESDLTYTWSATGPASVAFSPNGTNAAKNSVATFTQAGTYVLTATFVDPYGGQAVSSVTVVVKQTPGAVAIAPSPATVTIGSTQQFTATQTDQFGMPLVPGAIYTWAVTAGGGTVSSSGLYTAPLTPGSATVTATSDHGGTASVAITIQDATPTVATAASANPSPVTGTTTNLSVLGAYAGGESNLTYTWAETSGPAGVTFSSNGSNVSKASVATFPQAGTYLLTVTIASPVGTSVTSSVSVTVSQTLTKVAVAPKAASISIGGTQQLTASVTDQFGMPYSASVTWAVSSGTGTVSTAGLYTATAAPGTATVTATAGGLSDSAQITVNDTPVTVATAASASPSPVTGTTTTASVLGAYGGGAGTLTYTWTATGPASVTFSPNGTNAAQNSVATFSQIGAYTLTCTISDAYGETVTSSVSVSVTSTQTLTISPNSASVGVNGTQQFTATATNQFGAALTPTFTWSVTSGSGTVSSTGLYTASATTGPATVQVAAGGQTASASVTVTDTAPTVATAASASPSPVTGTSTTLTALGAYTGVGGESKLTYTWAVTSGAAGVTFNQNGTNEAKSTVATFPKAGSYTFTVTISDGITGTATATSVVTVMVNQTLTTLGVTPNTTTINIGGTAQFTATATDQFGTADNAPVTWSVTSGAGTVSGTGLFTATLMPGNAIVTATVGGMSSAAQVIINDTPVTVATPAAANPTTVTATTSSLSVLGAYSGGESNLTYHWAASGPAGVSFSANGTNAAKNSTATFDKAGNYTLTVTISNAYGESVTSSVMVTVSATQTMLTISPTAAAINVGGSQQFTVVATDQFGAAISPQPTATWSLASGVGSVSATGLYTVGATAGNATVQVASGGQTLTATVSVSDVPPTVATAASASPTPVTAKTTALSVLGAYAAGESNLTYTWSLTSGPAAVTFSANGTNAAKSSTATFTQAGTYVFLVTIATPGGLKVTSSVSVPVNQTSTSFVVTPATANVVVNGSLLLNAQVNDQFGNALASQPTLTWTISSGGGTVNSNGQFTAPATAGTTVVKVTGGTYSGTSTLTVIDSPPTFTTAPTATPNPVTGTTTALTTLGSYIGGESTLTYTWAVVSGPASVAFSANGTNAAKNCTATFTQAGSYNLSVTMKTQSGLTTTGNVTVVVNQTPTSVAVTPNPGTVGAGLTLQMTATSKDQFGNALSPPPSFAWTVASGGGTISASGLYTAPAATGTATVKATAGSASGTATINVINAGTLMGSVSTSSAAVNLTTQGTLDWEHWGRGAPGLDRKASGSLLTPYTLIGGGSASSYRTDPRLLSWTDGTPTATSTNNATGVDLGGIGSGYQLMAPASTTMRTAVIYVGGINAGGTLTASLSDGSSGMYVNTQPTTSGVWDAEYTITYAAGSANANLVVTWVQASGSTGAVTLSAMTLH